MGGRWAVQATVDEFGLRIPTAGLPHPLGNLFSIDHVAVPGSWRVLSAERVDVVRDERRLSDLDAYVVEEAPSDSRHS